MVKDRYPKFLPQWTKAVTHVMGLKYMNNKTEDQIIKAHDKVLAKYKKRFGLDWFEPDCCLTGEAFFHKPADQDWCEECFSLTYQPNAITHSLNDFYKYKNELAKHLKEDHPNTWNIWKDNI